VRNARAAVADPRLPHREQRQNGGFGVEAFDAPGHAVVAEGTVRNTRGAVADPRIGGSPGRFENAHGVQMWGEAAATVIAAADAQHGASVADPRVPCTPRNGAYGVAAYCEPAGTVLAAAVHDNGAFSVADPRPSHPCRGGSYGVQDESEPSTTVIGESTTFHGQNVRDPRGATRGVLWVVDGALVGPADVLARFDVTSKRPLADPPIIVAADGTWHRPMTTLELAALQSIPTRLGDDWLVLDGSSQRDYRQRIGNAVPVDTAEAIAETALRALLAADAGVWELGGEGVWVERGEEAAPCPA
jgi:hypothetical protein